MDQKWIFIFCVVEAALYYKATHSKWISRVRRIYVSNLAFEKRNGAGGDKIGSQFELLRKYHLSFQFSFHGSLLRSNDNFYMHDNIQMDHFYFILSNFHISFVFLYFSGSHQLEAIADKSHSGPCARQVVTFT